jgi:ectoine hydroxylase-related dioxygenase (phytanoyl-CoA dioxygenase family)
MDEREQFLFDLQGFLVIRNFLTPAEVQRLNEAVDANLDKCVDDANSHPAGNLVGPRKRGSFHGMLTWEQPWCQPFRELLAHHKVIAYLNTLFGRGWKLDHSPFILTGQAGAEGLILHGSTSYHHDGSQYYVYANGLMRCGMIVCQYQLSDVNAGDGGLCVIPGSHKANLPCAPDILRWEANQELVYNIPCKAGDMVIFNEATIHGTLPWTASHERRSLLYRYSPKYLHFAGGIYKTSMPDWVSELTEAQQAVLEPPYIYHRPLIEDDGVTVVRPRREKNY